MSSTIQPGTQACRKRRILMVDSSAENRAFLIETLAEQYELLTAASGGEALELLYGEKQDIALVLLQIVLTDMQGQDLFVQIHEDPFLMRVPVIAMGADRRMEAVMLNRGALDFMSLPGISPDAALARVRRGLDLYGGGATAALERDPLTGLYNRECFFRRVAQYDMYHPVLEMDAIIINIRHFHMINERYGNDYGDDVLSRLGHRLEEVAAANEGIACRREGDTFMVYCPHGADYEAVLSEISSGIDGRVRLRMGVYPSVDKRLDIERRFDRAKIASDTVRNSFTRAVAIYDDTLRRSEIYIEQLLEDFPKAIAQKQFVVYYQPKFAIQATMPVLSSAEALVRWIHPELGMISPGDFVPLFESNGLIQQLDSYVWREVARQMRDWKDRLDFCVPISVNVSRIDLFDNDLVAHMEGLMREFNIKPEEFLLEITESAYTQDSGQIINMVKKLREAGFHIEIDDFGSGYSSLNMISTLPIDALKLDMEFMHNAFKERKNTRMLDAVIDIAYSLDVPTIAEGVETAEQMFALKEMGCDIVQGYYFSKPLPAEQFEEFLIEKKLGRHGHITDRTKESSVKPAEQFAYEALHDPLTGLYNHSAYKMLLKDADQRNIALLLADVDDYDAIVARDGEETAGRILEMVAEVLRHNFRSVDFICRIGADEFAVIMTRVNSSMRTLIADKVERINAMIRERKGDLPFAGLSVGVAFADRENPQGDIFHDADVALERMKSLKQSGWVIY